MTDTTPTATVDVGVFITKYLALRDLKATTEKRHKAELAPYNDAMDKMETFFLQHLQNSGQTQLTSEDGTVYTTTLTSVKTVDKDAFIEMVKATNSWHLLDARPAKSAVEDYLAEKGTPPVGLQVSTHVNVNVRKK